MTETIDAVCKRFCPIFKMHPEESYNPCSVPDLIRNSKFKLTTTMPPSSVGSVADDENIIKSTMLDEMFETTAPPDTPPPITMDFSNLKNATKEELTLMFAPYTTKENKINRKYEFEILVKNIPNSVEVQAVFSDPFTFMKRTYFTVTYMIFFPYNGTLEPHVFDQEYATFVFMCSSYSFSDNTLNVVGTKAYRVYLSSHGKGKWYDWSKLKTSPDGRPILYSALEGHALYPEPITLRRFFGFGNDETADGGLVYDPVDNVVVLAHPMSTLITPYYELNQLYYYNGLYNDQPSNLFRTNNINFIFYDGYYKTTNTSEMWHIDPFKKFKYIFRIFMLALAALILLIVIDNNDVCVLASYIALIICTILCTFLFMWMYIV